jgi:hypothetical protein
MDKCVDLRSGKLPVKYPHLVYSAAKVLAGIDMPGQLECTCFHCSGSGPGFMVFLNLPYLLPGSAPTTR